MNGYEFLRVSFIIEIVLRFLFNMTFITCIGFILGRYRGQKLLLCVFALYGISCNYILGYVFVLVQLVQTYTLHICESRVF